MRDSWAEVTLEELTASTRPICYGVLKPGPYVPNGVPLVRITDMDQPELGPVGMHRISAELDHEFRRSRLYGNEVLLSIQGTVGKVSRCGANLAGGNISRTIALIDCDSRLMNNYLAYYLEWLSVNGKFNSSGSTRASLNISEIRTIVVPVPPLSEQKRIVDVIASVDEYIAALQQQATDARAARNAVLQELLTAGGDEWTETTLGDIAEVVGGGTPATSNPSYWDGDIVWLTPTEVVAAPGSVLIDSARKITESGLKNSGARLLPEGTVILTSRASVGFSALAGTALATNQGFQSLIPSAQINNKFLMFWIQNNQQEFISRAAGSTFKEISKANVRSIALALPPLSEQKRIVGIVTAMDDVVSATEQAVRVAQELRAGLLSTLLLGEHEIPDTYDRLLGAA